LNKQETRALANKFGLEVADKPDSQDICFVPDGNYRTIVTKMHPSANQKGKILHVDGFELGEHNGIINYTIGQRKGLGISFAEPLYVIKIDALSNIVYVGAESKLTATEFIIKEINWLDRKISPENLEVTVKIRSTRPGAYAKISDIGNDRILVKLLSAEKAVTPGQACVIYDNTRILGGGWIGREIS